MLLVIIYNAKMYIKNATHLCKTHGEDEVDTSELDNVLQ